MVKAWYLRTILNLLVLFLLAPVSTWASPAPPNRAGTRADAAMERLQQRGVNRELLEQLAHYLTTRPGISEAELEVRVRQITLLLVRDRARLHSDPAGAIRDLLGSPELITPDRVYVRWELSPEDERCAIEYARCLFECLGLVYPPAQAACSALCTALWLDCLGTF